MIGLFAENFVEEISEANKIATKEGSEELKKVI